MKNRIMKIIGITLALTLCVLTIAFVASATGVTKEHVRGDYSIDFSQSGVPAAGGRRYTAGGNIAFCVEPHRDGIPTQTITVDRYLSPGTGYDDLFKIAYYMYGGPGYTNSIRNTVWVGAIAYAHGNSDYEYSGTHLILGYAYSKNVEYAFPFVSTERRNALLDAYNYINSLPMPADVTSGRFRVFLYNEAASTQSFLGWEYDPMRDVTVNVTKKSSNLSISSNNSLYSLKGAEYGIYVGNVRIGSLTTDANGNASTVYEVEPTVTTLTIIETKAPPGFALDPTPRTVTIANDSASATIENKPQNDPIGIILRKRDAETNKPAPQGSALLSGAEFTVRYYAGIYNANQLSGVSPARRWTLRTDVNGAAFLNPNYLVSGDPFYYAGNGDPTLPLGTLTVQETKAPEGYHINNELFIRHITSEGVAESVSTYNVPIIPENVIRGGVEIEKWDIERDQRTLKQGDTTLGGAVLDIWNRSLKSVVVNGVEYAPNTVVYTMTTDKNGWAGTANNLLPYGDYEIMEKTPPTGYLNSGKIRQAFKIRQNGVVVNLRAGDDVIKNNIIRGGVEIEKWDIELDKTRRWQGEATLAGAVLDIWNRSIDVVIVNGTEYAPNTVVYTITTNENGWAGTASNLLPYGSYEIIERLPPNGYLNTGIIRQMFEIRTHGTVVNLKSSDKAIKNNIIRGGVEINKWDIEHDQTTLKQGDATLEGAVFEIWNRSTNNVLVDGIEYKPNTVVYTLTSDENGWAGTSTELLPYGNYEIIEKAPPTGYLNTGIISQAFIIRQHGLIVSLKSSDDVIKNDIIRGGVYVEKWDNEIDRREAQGAGTLEGAVFEIVNRSIDSVLVEDMLYAVGDVVYTMTTDSEGTVQTPNDLLPYGTYEIREVSPPLRGYRATGELSRIFEIREHGVIVEMNTTDTAIKNDPIRGDFRGVKISDVNAHRMAGVPFRITSVTTGESHMVVTDANGEFNTASSWNPHSQNTNRGETDLDGIWFGEIETLNDDVGALLFDTYLIEELRCEANMGRLLFTFELSVYRHNHVINLGTLTNEYVPVPEIGTTAIDRETTANDALVSEKSTIIDTVYYSGLQPGKWYTLKGILIDKATGEPLLINDEEVTSELRFRAFAESGAVTMEFTFNSLLLGGKSVVVFENLYFNDEEIAVHADIDDEGQTIMFFGPEIGTDAAGKDGNKIIPLDKEAVIIDAVKYENLVAGETYTLIGILMIKETGKPVLVSGKQVTSEVTFVAEGSSGTVETEFTFDSTGLEGKTLVVFEYLYYEGRLIAEHSNINDKAQTVTVESKEPPPEPTPTPTPAPPPPPKSPQTGHNGLPFWLLYTTLSLIAVAVVLTIYTRKRWKKESDE